MVGDEGVNLVLLSQRLLFPPVGRQGGNNGASESILLNGEPVEGQKPFDLKRGDRFVLELPGGGGFGDPAQRDPARAEQDRLDGLVG